MSVEYLEKQLGANERILYVQRHHWFFFVSRLIFWILAAVGIFVLLILTQTRWREGESWVWWGYLLLLVPLARISWGYLSWRVNAFALTNRRVVELTGIIRKTVSDSSLEKLTDIVLSQSLFGRLLGYGDIKVLTASEFGVNKLSKIARPLAFKKAMMDAKEALEREFTGGG